MDVQHYEAGQDKKWKNKGDNESGGNHKESPGKEVEVVWACDEKERSTTYEGGRWKWKYRGEGREEDLREDGWTK